MPAPLNRFIAASYRKLLRDAMPMLQRRLDAVAEGRVAPAIEAISIGSGRKVTAAVIFFDIRGFTALTSSDDPQTLKRILFMLNCIIPAMMRVLYRYGAYVEKNTGDGLMAILGIDTSEAVTANNALAAASEMFCVLNHIVNPLLIEAGIAAVNARIGIDQGQMLIARIGLPTGSAAHERSTLTAIGPSANIACKLQGMAGTNEIWCGDNIKRLAATEKQRFFFDVTPGDWNWTYGNNTDARYSCWKFNEVIPNPLATLLTGLR